MAIVVMGVLAGCTGQAPAEGTSAPPGDTASVPATVQLDLECPSSCYEPTVAVDGKGRVAVTVANQGSLAVATPGEPGWSMQPVPPLPADAPPIFVARGDGTLSVDPQGRLWYLSLVLTGSAGSLLFLGVQVARTEDGGKSWPVNTYIGLSAGSQELFSQAERPWLAFGPGVVYLAYPHWVASINVQLAFQGVPDGLMVLSSKDDGETFSPAVRAARPDDRYAIPGQPLVLADGTLLVPYTGSDGSSPSAYVLAVSHDEGNTFEHRVVTDDSGYRFPALAQDLGGTLWAAWLVQGSIQVSTSRDGVTWASPIEVNQAESLPGPSPWLVGSPDGGMVAAWSEGDDANIVLHRFPQGSSSNGTRHEGLVANGTAYTDFVGFAFGADGALWIPSADRETQVVFVTRWQPYLVVA